MMNQLAACKEKLVGKTRSFLYSLQASAAGFTMIETLVAISLMTVSIVAPMALTAQSLSSAYYARDQITAFYLAQEAIEAVRSVRDGNILQTSLGTPTNLLNGLPSTTGAPFIIDTRNNYMALCPGGVCQNVETDGTFYGYDQGLSGWTPTYFNRSVTANFVTNPDNSINNDEIKITATVSWQSGGFQARSISVSENLYRWVNDGSGSN